jgi:hypothetical protein
METLYKNVRDRDPFGFSYVGDLPADDPIATSSWTSDVGVTLDGPAFDAALQVTSIWIEKGTPRGLYIVRNDVISVGGRKRRRAFLLVVTDDA